MNQFIYFAAVTGSVDTEKGIIRDVSVVTVGEAKGHDVWADATTLEQVMALAKQFKGGLKVKTKHGGSFGDIVGSLKKFHVDGDQLKADFHLLKNHPMRESILEMAAEMPDTFGLSISFSGDRETVDGKETARVMEIYSCDLVPEPAANPSGLFSEKNLAALPMCSNCGFAVRFCSDCGASMQGAAASCACPKCGEQDSNCPNCGASLATEMSQNVTIKNISEMKTETLEADLKTAQTALETANKQVTELSDKLTAAEAAAKIAAESGAQITELSAKVVEKDAEIAKLKTDLLAAQGTKQVALGAASEPPMTLEQFNKKYHELSDPSEKRAFYVKHRAVARPW